MVKKKKNYKWILPLIIVVAVVLILLFTQVDFSRIKFPQEETMWDKFDNYEDGLMNCTLKASEHLNLGEFGLAESEISNCKNLINTALIEINKLFREGEDRELKIAKLDYEMSSYQLDTMNIIISLRQNEYSEIESLEKIERAQFLLRSTLYNFYKIEKEYLDTQYYQRYYESKKEEIENGIDNVVSLHHQLNQQINSYYDNEYGWMAKYFLQVDPLDPIIVEKTEEVSEFSYDKEDIKWALFDFVRTNIDYKYDPSWLTDWAQPPAITLLDRKGDCEDISILLASMFMRAGINNVELCSADTDGDSIYDHLFVAVDDIAWDGTYDGDSSSSSDVRNWKQKCFNVNEVVQNPTSAQIIECSSGYILGEDNLCHLQCGEGYCSGKYSCCDDECVSCSENSVLGEDCKCHETCGDGYCGDSSICCNNQCYENCPSGYVFGNDCQCHESCGNGYCNEGVYCFNGQCISCPSGTYLATDGRCYNY